MEREPRILTKFLRPKTPEMADKCSPEVLASVERFGIVNPLLITPDNQVYIGNQRLAAARLLGLEDVPYEVVRSTEDVQRALARYKEVEIHG